MLKCSGMKAKKTALPDPKMMSEQDLFNHSEQCDEPVHECSLCHYYMNELPKLAHLTVLQ